MTNDIKTFLRAYFHLNLFFSICSKLIELEAFFFNVF